MLRKTFKHFISISAIFVLIFSIYTYAGEYRGEVISATGEVYIIDSAGEHHAVEGPGYPVRETDTLVTDQGGTAIISFNDGVLSVLNENSRLRVEKTYWLSHLGGKIYFTFRKVFNGTRHVKTRFATLGIRGTTFIIYDNNDQQAVALQEGLLDIESHGPAFEIHRRHQLDEFEAFKQQQMQQQQKEELRKEFDEYRQQLQREFIEFKRNFSMQAEHVISFDGDRVDERVIDDDAMADFENFEAIAGDLLEEFREQARPHRENIESQPVLDEEDFE